MNERTNDITPMAGERGPGNEAIRGHIFAAIVDHRLAPGTHLKEDALCEVFGIGRTRVRAILSRLAADHVVELVANRGAFVCTPSIAEAREVFRARRVIEGHLVRRLAERPSKGVRAALEGHLAHEHAARAAGDQGTVIRRCATFHQVMADQAESAIMARFLRELIARSALIVAVYEARPPDACEFEEHRALSELVLAGHGDRAARMMQDHLQGIEDRLDLRPRASGNVDLRRALLGTD